jgi:FlaG/FlaF family flagellin (archaellin)
MHIKKKALSPLIATILLVAGSLSLAGILYSWSSQNFRDTTTSVSDASSEMIDCSNINMYIDSGCSYNTVDGFSGLILFDRSKIIIDQNIVITVIAQDNNITSMDIAPNFVGNAMSLDNAINNVDDFIGLATPLKRVQVHIKSCPEKATYISKCN